MIPLSEIAAELAREAAHRARAYPAMIERLTMTREQADYETSLCATWQADCARYAAWLAPSAQRTPIVPTARSRGFAWHERRSGLTRELDRRARLYPKWIAGGRLTQPEADRQIARLSAMADLYDEGYDWHDTFGTRPPFGARMTAGDLSPAETEATAQWWHHVHQTLATRHGAPLQEQLAL